MQSTTGYHLEPRIRSNELCTGAWALFEGSFGSHGIIPGVESVWRALESSGALAYEVRYRTIGTASLIVVKDASPADGTDFQFSAGLVGSPDVTLITLDDAVPDDGDAFVDSRQLTGLIAGSYEITETVPAGWHLDASCTGGTDPGTLVGGTLTVDIAPREDVVCTFVNTERVAIEIGDVVAAETDAGTDFVFPVTLDRAVAGGFTVPFATADGSATAASDYVATSGDLTFVGIAGEIQLVTVPVVGEEVVEGDETFTVTLGTPSFPYVSVSDDTGLGTIQNDDSATLAIDDVGLAEGNAGTTDFVFSVSLTGEVQDGFTLDYATADGTAGAPADYAAASGTLTFAGTPSEVQTVTVQVVGDPIVEDDETFTVELDPPSHPDVSATDDTGLGTIQNDDVAALLEATKEVIDHDPAADTVTYVVAITNVGAGPQPDDPASDELVDVLPPELVLVFADSDSPTFVVTLDPGTNTVLGNGTVGVGEPVTVTLEADVLAPPGTEISNQAIVRYDSDNDGSNDTTAPSDDPTSTASGDATLFVVGAIVLEIPTLGEWGLNLLTLGLLVSAAAILRRRDLRQGSRLSSG